ncbi:MAG: hypothetical protein KGS49_17230 [Planctomycetes bacterium]|nr:hypothetical protein [Planctomycetota bacterium]
MRSNTPIPNAYAKFLDVAAKVTATQQDEQDMVRRERMAIDEIRGLLAEMQAETTCCRSEFDPGGSLISMESLIPMTQVSIQ